MRAAADFLISQMGPRDLIVAHPAGVETSGIASLRNIIPGAVIAGEVTELNCMAAVALGFAAKFTGEERLHIFYDLSSAIRRAVIYNQNVEALL